MFDEIADAKTEQSAKLLKPTTSKNVVLGRGGGSSVFVLGILSPYDQRDLELDCSRTGIVKMADMLWPRYIAYLHEADAVQLPPHDRVRRKLDVIHAEILDVLVCFCGLRPKGRR